MALVLTLFWAAGSYAGGVVLEAGGLLEGNIPGGTFGQQEFLGFGLHARIGYETNHWGFGVLTRGLITSSTDFRIQANGKVLAGDLTRREMSLGPIVRYFFQPCSARRRWYTEAGFLMAQNDILNPENIYQLPAGATDEGIFINGFAVTLGAGVRLSERKIFLQFNYLYEHFGLVQVVGRLNEKKQVLYEYPIRGEYHVFVLSVAFGLFEPF